MRWRPERGRGGDSPFLRSSDGPVVLYGVLTGVLSMGAAGLALRLVGREPPGLLIPLLAATAVTVIAVLLARPILGAWLPPSWDCGASGDAPAREIPSLPRMVVTMSVTTEPPMVASTGPSSLSPSASAIGATIKTHTAPISTAMHHVRDRSPVSL